VSVWPQFPQKASSSSSENPQLRHVVDIGRSPCCPPLGRKVTTYAVLIAPLIMTDAGAAPPAATADLSGGMLACGRS
jgi:hypothetical protein